MNIIDNRKECVDIKVEVGDILDVPRYGLRMVINNSGKYSCIDLAGNVQLSWHDSIDEVVGTYIRWGETVAVIKNEHIDLIFKGKMEEIKHG